MKAVVIRYKAKGLSKTEASKLSKKLFGYKDKSNKGEYFYERTGLVTEQPHIKFAKGVFAIPKEKAQKIINSIKKMKAKLDIWEADIKSAYFK
jgi:hypothetical protein